MQAGPLLNLGAVPFLQMPLDFPNRHVAGVERQDLDVKAGPAGLVLEDALGLEAAVAVTGGSTAVRRVRL